jgi:ABC-2 type transport system permease protein
MNKVFVVIKREYLTRVRNKAFVIGTVLTPILMLALGGLPGYLATRGKGDRHIIVLNQSGDLTFVADLRKRLDPPVEGEQNGGRERLANIRYTFEETIVPPGQDIEERVKTLSARVEKNADEGCLLIPGGILTGDKPEYYAKNPSDFAVRAIEDAISYVVAGRRLAKFGFDQERLRQSLEPVDLQRRDPKGVEEKGPPRFVIGMVMLFFLYLTTLFYGIFVMRGVIEEKQSRIVEIVISSIKPFQLMMGKLIGIGLVGLTQYGIWIACIALLLGLGAPLFTSQGITLPEIPITFYVYFILYFILGYFLYATLYAMVGSMVSSEEDAQQVQMPVTLLVVLPMMLFPLIMTNPNSGLSTALSMVPFFAPTLMMMRIAMGNPPLYQILLSLAGMTVSIFVLVWIVARIYRVGILMYGKRPSIAELGRWIRYS